ncbi:MAG: ABC transporter ATP-binding protein [Candidatus Acidiferrales bacterium]
MEKLLQVRSLSVRYRSAEAETHQAVAGISFDVAAGEVVGLMGESGCGKSTTALALLGLLDKRNCVLSGSVQFAGQHLLSASMDECSLQKIRGAHISLVSQEPGIALSPVLRVGDQIAEVLRAHRDWSAKRCRAEAKQWLGHVGLIPTNRFYSAFAHQLSGGQLQRVVLAQALACRPELVIADEPTASLDARNQAEFLALLRDLKAELGISVLLISHAPEIQATLADRILVMHAGRLVEEGTFGDLYRNASHPYTQALLRRVPQAGVATDDIRQGEAAATELLAR